MSPTAICRVLWSVGNVRGWAPPPSWVTRALAATNARIGGFTGSQLALLATSLARLEHRPTDGWLATFGAAAAARFGELAPDGRALANLLWALASLGYAPDGAWLDAAWRAAAGAAGDLAPPQLLQVTWALPALAAGAAGGGGYAPPAAARKALLARGPGVLDTPRASLQRMRWAERAAAARAKAEEGDAGAPGGAQR